MQQFNVRSSLFHAYLWQLPSAERLQILAEEAAYAEAHKVRLMQDAALFSETMLGVEDVPPGGRKAHPFDSGLGNGDWSWQPHRKFPSKAYTGERRNVRDTGYPPESIWQARERISHQASARALHVRGAAL